MSGAPVRTSPPLRPAETGGGPGVLRIQAAPRRIALGSLIGGLLLVFATAIAFLVAWEHVGGGPVLVAARDVAAGQVLQADDLRVSTVGGSGDVAFLPASQRAAEIGRPAAVDLVAGQPLVAADVGRALSQVGAGQAVVALALQAGAFPPALAAGDRVMVVDTGTATAASVGTAPAAPPPAVLATVLRVDDAGSALQGVQRETVVSLRVPAQSAAAVARSAAAGRASLAVLPPGG